jgi:hypothetical protein
LIVGKLTKCQFFMSGTFFGKLGTTEK